MFVQHSRDEKIKFSGKASILLLGILLLTACGQKGALYLPDEPQTFKSAFLRVNAHAIVHVVIWR